jgi:hypothetical protein
MTGRPTLTGGTSRAGAATLSAVLTRAGTVVPVPETHVATAQASAVTHATAAAHVPMAIHVLATIRAGAQVPASARILVLARAAFQIPAWIQASARWGPVAPTHAGAQVPARGRILVLARAAFQIPAWIQASPRSGLPAPIRAGVPVRAHTGLRTLALAGILASVRAVVLAPTRAGILALTCAGVLAPTRAGSRVLVCGRTLVAVRAEIFHRAEADREWIPGLVAARIPDSAPATMPGSGRGPGLTTRQRGGADRTPTAGHGRMPCAVRVRHRLMHGLLDRAANPVPARASEPPAGTAGADRSMLLE